MLMLLQSMSGYAAEAVFLVQSPTRKGISLVAPSHVFNGLRGGGGGQVSEETQKPPPDSGRKTSTDVSGRSTGDTEDSEGGMWGRWQRWRTDCMRRKRSQNLIQIQEDAASAGPGGGQSERLGRDAKARDGGRKGREDSTAKGGQVRRQEALGSSAESGRGGGIMDAIFGEDGVVSQLVSMAMKRPLLALMAFDSMVELLQVLKGSVPRQVLLELDLSKLRITPGEPSAASYLEALQAIDEPSLSLRAIMRALRLAAADARVMGLVLMLPANGAAGGLDLATVQELIPAILQLRASGKLTVSWAPSFGDGGGGNLEYLLASACQYVWLQPSGSVGLIGLQAEVPFVRDALVRWKVQAQFSGREEYKSAMHTFTERGFTPAQRRNVGALLDSAFAQLTTGVARARAVAVSFVPGQAALDAAINQ